MNLSFQRPGTDRKEAEYFGRPLSASEAPVLRTPAAWPPASRQETPVAMGLIYFPDLTAGVDEILFV